LKEKDIERIKNLFYIKLKYLTIHILMSTIMYRNQIKLKLKNFKLSNV